MKVTVLDYGLGNLFSVRRALEVCGAEVTVTDDPGTAAGADRLVLPGVGAFAHGMAALARLGLDDALRAHAASGRPLLGICVGLQLFFEVGEEFEPHPGLGLIPGRVAQIPDAGGRWKRPHLGWNAVVPARDWAGTLFAATAPGAHVYFAHSFAATDVPADHVLATTPYGDGQVVAAVTRANVTGLQFHPERSGPVGLGLLKGFLAG